VNPERVVPKSIVLAVGVTTLTHLLVSVSVARLMSWEELSLAGCPLLIQR
jgi:amino acid transporter